MAAYHAPAPLPHFESPVQLHTPHHLVAASTAPSLSSRPAAAASSSSGIHISKPALYVIGGAVVVGVAGLLTFSYFSNKKAAAKEHERKRIVNIMHHQFNYKFAEIIKYVYLQSWNRFSVAALRNIHGNFVHGIENKFDGILTRRDFHIMHKKMGFTEPKVIDALLRFWDQNRDSAVDFIELCEGLNTLQYGTKVEKLQRLFRVYDLNDDKKITDSELRLMLGAFSDFKDAKSLDSYVAEVFESGDLNHDRQLTYTEFVKLANNGDLTTVADQTLQYNKQFLEHFGITEAGSGTAKEDE